MHSCFIAVEVQELIFQHVQGRRSLANLAVTCQAFKETALDLLWQGADSLGPLIKTMSKEGDLWDLRGADKDLVFIRALEERDWSRFHYYAPRIRNLRMIASAGVSSVILEQLATYQPPQPMLRRIKTLEIGGGQDLIEGSHHIPPLIGSTLQELKIRVDSDVNVQQVRSLLFDLAKLCPNVERFTGYFPGCDFGENIDYNSATLKQLIPRWRQLDNLKLTGFSLTGVGMHTWVVLKRLHRLNCRPAWDIGGAYKGRIDSIAELDEGFLPACTNLVLQDVSDWENHVVPLIKAISGPLEELRVFEWLLPNPYQPRLTRSFSDTFSRIVGKFTSLRRLHLASFDYPSREDRSSAKSLLSPLFNLRHLRYVQLSTFLLEEVDDTFLFGVSCSWQRLTSLKLTVPYLVNVSEGRTRMTFRGLFPIFENCVDLATLEISVICMPVESTILKECRGSRSITLIRFMRAPLLERDVSAFLEQLRTLLPRGVKIGTEKSNEEDCPAWNIFKENMRYEHL